jgi:hypothetical protein
MGSCTDLWYRGLLRTNRFFLLTSFETSVSGVLDLASSSAFLPARKLAAMSNGILVLLLSALGGVEVA